MSFTFIFARSHETSRHIMQANDRVIYHCLHLSSLLSLFFFFFFLDCLVITNSLSSPRWDFLPTSCRDNSQCVCVCSSSWYHIIYYVYYVCVCVCVNVSISDPVPQLTTKPSAPFQVGEKRERKERRRRRRRRKACDMKIPQEKEKGGMDHYVCM